MHGRDAHATTFLNALIQIGCKLKSIVPGKQAVALPSPTQGAKSIAQIEALEQRTFFSSNPIVAENLLPGTPPSQWQVTGNGDLSLQGFATDISVQRGQPVQFKISDTTNAAYHIDLFRLGYYQGMGARRVATIGSAFTTHPLQPTPFVNHQTGLVDCGNWEVASTWNVPATATSGVYAANLVRDDTGTKSQIIFIVRDDFSHSDLLFKTSDTTWEAYNTFGGTSLYSGPHGQRAYKVSYNRPLLTRGDAATNAVFHTEYPMIRWLESNGYDVSYFTSVDADRFGSQIFQHKTLLSVGHDEYWSGNERANVEAARNAGINLAFFSGNEIFWKTRWEASAVNETSAYRTLVCYKDTHANRPIDPNRPTWTGTWRDPRFSPPGDGGRPENALSGTMFAVNGYTNNAITVPAVDGKMRFWRNTSVASLNPGGVATFPTGTLGNEWDQSPDNAFRPAGEFNLSSTTVGGVKVLQDYGSTYAIGTATHHLSFYKARSGALVFGAGTLQWSWGLDSTHDYPFNTDPPADPRMQQATVNLLADMQAQPGTLAVGMIPAYASTDTTAPTSRITSPFSDTRLEQDRSISITGTASDIGGMVGGVEVSIDGGLSWHPAVGRENWVYSWTPHKRETETATLLSRAVDDSGNLEVPGPGVTVQV